MTKQERLEDWSDLTDVQYESVPMGRHEFHAKHFVYRNGFPKNEAHRLRLVKRRYCPNNLGRSWWADNFLGDIQYVYENEIQPADKG